ncbi:MAG TPA: hypothetical protein VK213_10485 [Bacteroidales bacterium]|nr:hypothetical protein [Bacteroidales bacterium]
METNNDYRLVPGFRNSFGTGWEVMQDNFLRLFLVVIIIAILTAPLKMFDFKFDLSDFNNIPYGLGHELGENLSRLFTIGAMGMLAVFLGLLALLYSFLVAPVFIYGSDFIFVQAVRRIKPDFEYLVKGFMENYFTIVLAHLLVTALVVMGFFMLIIPGIIIACRLVFVSYIVMDKKIDPIEAVEMSWRLTRGHGWRIFLMGIASFFIVIFGLLLLIVGVFPAVIWIGSSFASMYESVLRQKEPVVVSSAA